MLAVKKVRCFLTSARASRVAQLQKELEVSTSKFDREKLGERIAALSGGIARIMASRHSPGYVLLLLWSHTEAQG